LREPLSTLERTLFWEAIRFVTEEEYKPPETAINLRAEVGGD